MKEMDNHERDVLWREIYDGIAKGMAFTDAGVDDIRQATENVYRYIRSGCKCGPGETSGQTSFMCCNICGLIDEDQTRKVLGEPEYTEKEMN